MSTAFRFVLVSGQEVGTGSTSTATGLATVVFDSVNTTLSYYVTVDGLDFGELLNGGVPDTADSNDDVTAMHIHNAARGANGAVVFDVLPLSELDDADDFTHSQNPGGSRNLIGLWETTDPASTSLSTFAAALGAATPGNDVSLYFNIHSAQFGGGAIRGQFVCIADDNDNVVLGAEGDDRLPGLGGADQIHGGTGDDLLEGGDGNDLLNGGEDADTMHGGAGDDTYYIDNAGDVVVENAGAGSDFVLTTITRTLGANFENLGLLGTDPIDGTGNALDNFISGNQVANTLSGLGGADSFDANDGDDTVLGGDGNDVINGAEGNDTLDGGNHNDILVGGFGADTLYGRNGDDALYGYDDPDTLVGHDGGDYLDGGAANDTLDGGAGADTLNGDSGDDRLNGGAGADSLGGGLGIDLADYSRGTVGVEVNLTLNTGVGGEAAGDTFSGIENLIGTALADRLTGTNDNNFIYGLAGDDRLWGNAGNDILIGAAGADILTGGAGTDATSYHTSLTGVRVVLFQNQGFNGEAQGDLFGSIENIIGSPFADEIFGDNANNELYGQAGVDQIEGRTGNDYLDGGAGNDRVSGQDGNDTLFGGADADQMFGGTGADGFFYRSVSESAVGAADQIMDFTRAHGDKIDLGGIDANTNTGGDQAFTYIGAAAFSNVAGQLRYAANLLEGDVNGDGVADFQIQLNAATLLVDDFRL